jgi:hypothetical protein
MIIYKTDDGYIVEQDGARKFVPIDPRNADYRAVGEAIAAGVAVEDYTPEAGDVSLTPLQWQYFLAVTGFDQMIEQVLAAMPTATFEQKANRAALVALVHHASVYPLSATLKVKAMLAGVLGADVPSDEDVTQAFMAAAAFRGFESLTE